MWNERLISGEKKISVWFACSGLITLRSNYIRMFQAGQNKMSHVRRRLDLSIWTRPTIPEALLPGIILDTVQWSLAYENAAAGLRTMM
jgi:hypothetical protein